MLVSVVCGFGGLRLILAEMWWVNDRYAVLLLMCFWGCFGFLQLCSCSCTCCLLRRLYLLTFDGVADALLWLFGIPWVTLI